MLRRYIRRACAIGPFQAPLPDDAVREWTRNFAPNAARRMTRLGLMLGAALKDFSIEPDDAVVYASTYGETLATERYLDSFPAASPLHFQTSIHPSAIEQVLINRAYPVRELTPLAGERDLPAHAALTALTTPNERVVLCGGEEIGGWLLDIQAASDTAFAFAIELSRTDGDGVLEHQPDAEAPPGTLREFFDAIREQKPWRCAAPSGGAIVLTPPSGVRRS